MHACISIHLLDGGRFKDDCDKLRRPPAYAMAIDDPVSDDAIEPEGGE